MPTFLQLLVFVRSKELLKPRSLLTDLILHDRSKYETQKKLQAKEPTSQKIFIHNKFHVEVKSILAIQKAIAQTNKVYSCNLNK